MVTLTECVSLLCFNALPDIFAVVNCSVLALSAVFCSGFLTWSADNLYSLQTNIAVPQCTHCSDIYSLQWHNVQQRVRSACRKHASCVNKLRQNVVSYLTATCEEILSVKQWNCKMKIKQRKRTVVIKKIAYCVYQWAENKVSLF